MDGKGPISLNFHKQPPEYPFKDKWFPVQIFLQQSDGEPRCGYEMPISLKLFYYENPRVAAPPELLEIDPTTLTIRKDNGSCEARCRILACSMDVENREFMLCAEALDKSSVVEAISIPMKVMRHRLVIDEARLKWEETWYKDEGGRDKCIEIPVRLVDAADHLVTSRKLPLKITLLYETTLIVVTDQTILKLSPPHGGPPQVESFVANNAELVVEEGVALVRLRIEDVSKNHQGQNFIIKIAPDTLSSPMDCDVAHAITPRVTVRSKRNKRRAAQQQMNQTSRLSGGSGHQANNGGPFAPSPAVSGNNLMAMPPHHASPANLTAMLPVAPMPPPSQQPESSSGTSHIAGSIAKSLRSADNLTKMAANAQNDLNENRARTALQAAMGWIKTALGELRQMEWQHIGYEALGDGSGYDQSKPLYAIVNPNDHIQRLITAYDNGVAPHTSTEDEPFNGADATKRQRRREIPSALSPPTLSRERTSVNAVMQIINEPPLERFTTNTIFPEDDQDANTMVLKRPPIAVPPEGGGGFEENGRPAKLPKRDDATKKTKTNGSLAPPPLLRGVSSLYVGEAVGGTGTSPRQPQAIAEGTDLAEQNVRLVIAKRFKPPRADAVALGFPAFDGEKRLVGLYREIQDGASTQIVFIAASDPDAGLEPGDADIARRAYDKEVASKSDSLHDLNKHGNLDRLKENVMIYHWSKEAFANDIDSKALAAQDPSTTTTTTTTKNKHNGTQESKDNAPSSSSENNNSSETDPSISNGERPAA